MEGGSGDQLAQEHAQKGSAHGLANAPAGQTGQAKQNGGLVKDAPDTADSQNHATQPSRTPGVSSEDRALTPEPEKAADKASHGKKRPVAPEKPRAGSQPKRRRGSAGQVGAGTPDETQPSGTQADPFQSRAGARQEAAWQRRGGPSSGRQTPEVEDVTGEDEGQVFAGGVVQRSVAEVAGVLSCDLCSNILRDPITAPECMHSFCRECIEAELVGSLGGNICPACARDGERTLLGANPFAYHRLQPDFVLEALVRKIFPRHILLEHEKRRPKYVPQRLGQLLTEQGARPSRARGQQMPPADVVPLFLHQKGKDFGDGEGKQLEMPYLRVPKVLPVAVLAKYVAQRVSEMADARIQLFHKDTALSEGQTIHEAAETFMPPDTSGASLLELCYMVVQSSPTRSDSSTEILDSEPVAKQRQIST